MFTSEPVKALYQTFASTIRHDQYSSGITQIQNAIDVLSSKLIVWGLNPLAFGHAVVEGKLLRDAQVRCQDVALEALRVPALSSGNGSASPHPVSLFDIEATALDYQLAVLQASQGTASYGAFNALGKADGSIARDTENRSNVFDIYGDTLP